VKRGGKLDRGKIEAVQNIAENRAGLSEFQVGS
jgi:hypothetical protein